MKVEQELRTLRNLIELLNGHMTATQVLVSSLIATHPNPEAFRKDAEKELEEAIAACLHSQHASEPMLEGMQSAGQMLLAALQPNMQTIAQNGTEPKHGE